MRVPFFPIICSVVSLLALAPTASGYETLPPLRLSFDLESEALCFRNADPDLSQFGPLGVLGETRGICQGIAGLAAAFHGYAAFRPHEQPTSRRDTKRAIEKLIGFHKGHCVGRTVEVPGYSSVADLCGDYRLELLRAAMGYNANIFMREVVQVLPDFLSLKGGRLRDARDRVNLKRTLDSIYSRLKKGEPALVMYYSHVVLAVGMSYDYQAGRPVRARIETYDSNSAASNQFYTPGTSWLYTTIEADGLPSASNRMLWDVTPERRRARCD